MVGSPSTSRRRLHRVRTIGIPESLVGPLAALCEGLGRDDLVFTSPRGGPIRSRSFRARVWIPATEAVGLDGLTVHELRHTCVALLISQGVGPKQIQAQLGHEDVRTTLQVYGHLFEGHEDVTAAAMDAAIAAASGMEPRWNGGPTGGGSALVAPDLRERPWR